MRGENSYRALVMLALICASRQDRSGFQPGPVSAMVLTGRACASRNRRWSTRARPRQTPKPVPCRPEALPPTLRRNCCAHGCQPPASATLATASRAKSSVRGLLYFHFLLRLRMVEQMLAFRCIVVSHEGAATVGPLEPVSHSKRQHDTLQAARRRRGRKWP
jgi:hypothetical protein